MTELAPALSADELEARFADIAPPLNANAAKAEADRCLYCYDAPCTIACPTHIDVPAFIKKIGFVWVRFFCGNFWAINCKLFI